MKLKIGGAALNQTPIDWVNNLNNIKNAISQANSDGVNLLLLPELCITGYGCEDLFLANWLYTTAWGKLMEIVPYTQDITVSIGLPLKYEGHNYNVHCLIENCKIIGFAAKQFLANDGVHYEHRWFTPWPKDKIVDLVTEEGVFKLGDIIVETKGIRVGYEICEDAWHQEDRPGIGHCQHGVDLLLNPSASHFSFGKTLRRENEVVVNASKIFNCVYLYANLLGNEAGRIVYDGEILIAGYGQLWSKNNRCSFKDINLISCNIDFKERICLSPILINDQGAKEIEFVKALALCLFDYMRKSKSKGFVLSLSGGADSSISAVMVAEMIKRGIEELGVVDFIKKTGNRELQLWYDQYDGKQSIEQYLTQYLLSCVYQWAANSGWDTFESAKELADGIGAKFYSWKIDKEVTSYTDKIEVSLQRKLTWETDDIALQNIQARSRAPIVWMLANIKQALLITTSNRSEGDVGYATMDGDTCGSIAPIAGIEKSYIQFWLKWAENHLNYPALSYVNGLTPTAELRPSELTQTDEKDLMPYVILAAIEREAIRNHKSPLEVFKSLKSLDLENENLLKTHIAKFYKMWSRNQWKRERLAPSFLLDDFNVDPRTWCRFPILNGGYEEEIEEMLKSSPHV